MKHAIPIRSPPLRPIRGKERRREQQRCTKKMGHRRQRLHDPAIMAQSFGSVKAQTMLAQKSVPWEILCSNGVCIVLAMKTFEAKTPAQWQRWLHIHHTSEAEVWLVFHKKQTGRPCVAYSDALDEALCYGWIDSLIKRIDEERYARKFTPRKAESKWSAVNRQRYAELKAAGRLKSAGLARPPTNRTYEPRKVFSKVLPKQFITLLKKHPEAWNFFRSLAPLPRSRYVFWINSAKLQATQERRFAEMICLLEAGKELGLR